MSLSRIPLEIVKRREDVKLLRRAARVRPVPQLRISLKSARFAIDAFGAHS